MPLRIGHRGAAGHAPENTLRSFHRALDLGVDLIESDLRVNADDEIVLAHDLSIERADVRQPVSASTRATLDLVTLPELLDLANGHCGLMLEIKVEGLARRILDAVAASTFAGPVIYASFHHDELLTIRRLQPEAQTLALIHGAPVDKAQFAIDAQATHAGINLEFATAKFVSALQENGFKVFVYTVDEPEDIAAMKALRVDGIISDYPDRL